MLEEGRGGFSDFHKYRDALIKVFWDLTAPEQPVESAMEEARRLHEQMMGPRDETE